MVPKSLKTVLTCWDIRGQSCNPHGPLSRSCLYFCLAAQRAIKTEASEMIEKLLPSLVHDGKVLRYLPNTVLPCCARTENVFLRRRRGIHT